MRRNMSKPWNSKLIPFERNIIAMWRNRTTQMEIKQWLQTKGIKISQPAISKFLKVRRLKTDPHLMELPSVAISENPSPEATRKIPEMPKPIITPKPTMEKNNDIETVREKEMNRLRQKLKRKAHADPMASVFIRKEEKNEQT